MARVRGCPKRALPRIGEHPRASTCVDAVLPEHVLAAHDADLEPRVVFALNEQANRPIVQSPDLLDVATQR